MAKKKSKFKIGTAIVLLILLIVGAIGGSYYYENFIVKNVSLNDDSTYLFIPKGSTQETVLNQIDSLQLVEDMSTLRWLADKKNYRGQNVVPGKYKIENQWTNNRLINHLRAGNGRLDAKVSFNNVRTLKQLSGAITKDILLDSTEVYAWLTNEKNIKNYGFNKYTIVSMFIPNTYHVDFDISVDNLMKRMAKEYKAFWNAERLAKLKQIGLSQSEATTLASIVYSETNSKKDMPTIAGVYMNRIRIGMPLQADPTLIFALDDYSIRRVLNKHKKIDSPYNTYKYKGLPPGPILIPPITYIDAVLDYEKHNYLYFVAKEDFSGDSYFAKNYAQHLIYARRYQKALNQRRVYR